MNYGEVMPNEIEEKVLVLLEGNKEFFASEIALILDAPSKKINTATSRLFSSNCIDRRAITIGCNQRYKYFRLDKAKRRFSPEPFLLGELFGVLKK